MSDLISRQAAIDALGEAPEVWTDSPEEFAALHQWEMDVTAIEAVPSAERKTERWIRCKEQDEEDLANDNALYVCSNCGHADLQAESVEVPFCWHCGARMERGKQ